jgi:hypothetical protein
VLNDEYLPAAGPNVTLVDVSESRVWKDHGNGIVANGVGTASIVIFASGFEISTRSVVVTRSKTPEAVTACRSSSLADGIRLHGMTSRGFPTSSKRCIGAAFR